MQSSINNSLNEGDFFYNPTSDFENFLATSGVGFMGAAKELLGANFPMDVYRRLNLGGSTSYRRNRVFDAIKDAYIRKLNDINTLNTRYKSKTSLQDYINKKFGVGGMPQGQG